MTEGAVFPALSFTPSQETLKKIHQDARVDANGKEQMGILVMLKTVGSQYEKQ